MRVGQRQIDSFNSVDLTKIGHQFQQVAFNIAIGVISFVIDKFYSCIFHF